MRELARLSYGATQFHWAQAGFLPQAFINFLCLLGWSPKNDREFLTLDELTAAFTLEGVNRSNAVINFTEEDPFDPKAVWLNAEHIRALPVDALSTDLQPFFEQAGFDALPDRILAVTPLFRFSDPETALYLLDRELSEELRLERQPEAMNFRGLLYDPRTTYEPET